MCDPEKGSRVLCNNIVSACRLGWKSAMFASFACGLAQESVCVRERVCGGRVGWICLRCKCCSVQCRAQPSTCVLSFRYSHMHVCMARALWRYMCRTTLLCALFHVLMTSSCPVPHPPVSCDCAPVLHRLPRLDQQGQRHLQGEGASSRHRSWGACRACGPLWWHRWCRGWQRWCWRGCWCRQL